MGPDRRAGQAGSGHQGRCVTDGRTTPRSAAGDGARAGLRPLLLVLAAALTVLPAAIDRDAPVLVLVYLGVASVGLTVLVLRGGDAWLRAHRDLVTILMIVVALLGFGLVLWGDGGQHPEHYLFGAAAFVCAVASMPSTWLRWTLQAAVLAMVLVSFLRAGRPPTEVAFVLIVCVSVACLIGLFAHALVDTRGAMMRARADAANRIELLDAVRTLPGRSVEDAASAVHGTLTAMGFDAASVARIEDGFLVPVVAEPTPVTAGVPRGVGPAWIAIERDETVVVTDHVADDGFGSFAAGIVVPLRVDGEPVGALTGAFGASRVLDAAQIETVEVLAAHLGGVLAADARVARQAELLERMATLDRMRQGLVTAVSAEVRDPLTIVRGVGQVLSAHGDQIAAARRQRFLEHLVTQSEDLQDIIETLLDFSRSQSQRDDPRPRPTPVVELLAPLVEMTQARTSPTMDELARARTIVHLDPALIRDALQLLLATPPVGDASRSAVLEVTVSEQDVLISILRGAQPPTSELVVSLVSQLCTSGNGSLHLGDEIAVRLPLASDDAYRRAVLRSQTVAAAHRSGPGS